MTFRHHFCSAVEQFIRAKYERKQYILKGGSAETAKPATQSGKESQEQKTKNKAKKIATSTAAQKSSSEQVSGCNTKVNISRSNGHECANPFVLPFLQISMPRPSGRSPSPQPPTPFSTKTKGSDLISLDTRSSKPSSKQPSPQPSVDLLTGLAPVSSNGGSSAGSSSSSSLVSETPGNQPLFGAQTHQQPLLQTPSTAGTSSDPKDSIMSLYGQAQNQSQLSSYTAQGYPVNSFYYQQQQEAAMRMAHVAALQQHQVNQVTAQMQEIKISQHQHSPPMPSANHGVMSNSGMGAGGQTLNPTLW